MLFFKTLSEDDMLFFIRPSSILKDYVTFITSIFTNDN